MKAFKTTMIATAAAVLAAGTASAEKWDMPMAYAASNFHSEMGVVFAEKVKSSTQMGILKSPFIQAALCLRAARSSGQCKQARLL